VSGRLDGKVTMITGAARGQGRSHAVNFAEEGADLVLLDIGHDLEGCRVPLGTPEQLERTAERCRELGARVTTALCDVRDAEAVEAVVAEGVVALGRIDVLINNAGVSSPTGLSNELSPEGWRLVMGINLDGPFYVGRAVARHMIERGGQGCIINISSSAGIKAMYGNVAYVASKHGVIGLTRSMAIDLAPHGIRVNTVLPGSVRDDPALESRMLVEVARDWDVPEDEYEEVFAAYHLLPVLMEARDISRTCVWLASDDGVRITGSVISADAGFVTK
jgi:NAD(P)-dependent dehydrogenase (short-subunit alcohol dehydrogenase family)